MTMSENRLVKPDPLLMARLYAACVPARGSSAVPLRAGKPGEIDHVLETPENVAPDGHPMRRGDYSPEEA